VTPVVVLHDVGDPELAVSAGAYDAIGRRAAWNWSGREVRLWQKNPDKRGFMVVRTK